jgi:hypothetical protein
MVDSVEHPAPLADQSHVYIHKKHFKRVKLVELGKDLLTRARRACPQQTVNVRLARLSSRRRESAVYKRRLAQIFKLLRTREEVGDAGDVPARSARRRDLTFVERTRDRPNAQEAFGLNGA